MNHKRQTAAAMAAAAGKDARQGTRLSIKRVAKAGAGSGSGMGTGTGSSFLDAARIN